MKQELKNDLIASWNEAEELHCNLTSLSDGEILAVKDSLIERCEWIMHWLGKYVTDKDIIKQL